MDTIWKAIELMDATREDVCVKGTDEEAGKNRNYHPMSYSLAGLRSTIGLITSN